MIYYARDNKTENSEESEENLALNFLNGALSHIQGEELLMFHKDRAM